MHLRKSELFLFTGVAALVALFVAVIELVGLTRTGVLPDFAGSTSVARTAVFWSSFGSLGGLFLLLLGVMYRSSLRELELLRTGLREQRSRDELDRFFNLSGDMLCIARVDGYMERVNPAFAKTLGHSEAEMLSKPFLDFVHWEDRESTAAEIEKLSKGSITNGFTDRFLCSDGSYKWLAWTGIPVPDEGLIYAIARDITEQQQRQEHTEVSLREKEGMLTEIHHRVKNNMQLMSSLLSLQSDSLTDVAALKMFQNCQNQIKTMALVHEQLYQSTNPGVVEFSDYVPGLVGGIIGSQVHGPTSVSIDLQVDGILLDVDTAIVCGLIINELVSNSVQHAFPGRPSGLVNLGLHTQGNTTLNLTVTDNGVGLPPEVDYRSGDSLGFQLVNMLVDQLDGEMELNPEKGTAFSINFPNPVNNPVNN